ncbi:MAG TPA: hypothetical protein VGQ23_07055 [Burkholderiaceae bacterium]|nr:hypothetical protein [Burkholderiaceae bacterium]
MEPESVLRTYFHAKDENRPHLMRRVFTDDAVLRMQVKSEAIAFPAETHGLAAISEVLVSRFGQSYENVYSFYLSRPTAGDEAFTCDWLVGMSVKGSGELRVGCGRYDWTFQRSEPWLACALDITIEQMQVLPARKSGAVFAWLTALDYPWASAQQVLASAPAIMALSPVLQYLGRRAPHC